MNGTANDNSPVQVTDLAAPVATDAWDEAPRRLPTSETGDPLLVVDVDGFEGPLDLLLALARSQKVDLAKISILDLADQYLAFIEELRRLRLELAADYLVMAAWLAYLKSRLLLPEPIKDDEPSGADLAEVLAFRLKKLEAIRSVASQLMVRPQMNRDVFPRGLPTELVITKSANWVDDQNDLLKAYAGLRQRQMVTTVHVKRRDVWSLADAREILGRLIGVAADWTSIERFLSPYLVEGERRTVRASSFSALLEMVREGAVDLRQAAPFQPLYIRARKGGEGADG